MTILDPLYISIVGIAIGFGVGFGCIILSGGANKRSLAVLDFFGYSITIVSILVFAVAVSSSRVDLLLNSEFKKNRDDRVNFFTQADAVFKEYCARDEHENETVRIQCPKIIALNAIAIKYSVAMPLDIIFCSSLKDDFCTFLKGYNNEIIIGNFKESMLKNIFLQDKHKSSISLSPFLTKSLFLLSMGFGIGLYRRYASIRVA